MIKGHNTIEWLDGVPSTAGYYLCLTKDNYIERCFREISISPSGKLHKPPAWILHEGYDKRACDDGYIIAWAEWPRESDIIYK